MSKARIHAQKPTGWLTVMQAAEYAAVSRSTIWQWMKAGDIKFRQHSRRGNRFIRVAELDRYLDPFEGATA